MILVMDAQNSFLDESGSVYLGKRAEILVIRLKDFLASSSDHKLFFRTVHALNDDFFRSDVTHSVVSTQDVPVCSELQKYANEIEDKTRYDAFFGTTLRDSISNKKIKKAVICGLETHTSILFTAGSLRNMGIEVEVIEPCCMSRDQHMHDYAIALMRNSLGVRISG